MNGPRLGRITFPLREQGLVGAWVGGGGYKYLEMGEGNCFRFGGFFALESPRARELERALRERGVSCDSRS